MKSEPERIYWDSCAYISLIEETPGRADVLREILEAAKAGRIVFVASALVLAEVVKLKHTAHDSAEQSRLIREFFENDFISVRTVDRKTAEEAREICRVHGLKPPDAIHVATAVRYNCACLQTYDGEKGEPTKLLAFSGKIGTPPLRIELPTPPPKLEETKMLPGMGDD